LLNLTLNGFLNSKVLGETKCKIDDISRCVKGALCFAYNFISIGIAPKALFINSLVRPNCSSLASQAMA